ncbi:hypothetical protein PACTADRAFT_75089 [Pachysolen tannophilus NRRL Y-2460]|uniref:Uncharacterized protein n=1 Tax=Pachysolen tannophilus NRRL Y-2460 TaxID=669874 RepID=A0A1E4TVW7_PACTA|nr:hypothetical protein PACTADRAFT_75089 [Pachysolen tannophilus NRRL Y-2460]
MSQQSRRTSPTKLSRSSTPLQVKNDSNNILRKTNSPKKNQLCTENFSSQASLISPTRTSPVRKLTSRSSSPLKTIHNRNTNFKIYQDDTDYREEILALQETQLKKVDKPEMMLLTPEQEMNKENENKNENTTPTKSPVVGLNKLNNQRIPLSNLDIKLYPGFVQSSKNSSKSTGGNNVLRPKMQLLTSYRPYAIQVKNLPSFVTPPRSKKFKKIDYRFNSKGHILKKVNRSLSFDNRVFKPFIDDAADLKKKLEFKIYDDQL